MATSQVTPMLQQYFQAKEEAGDAILFFRLGDFYEMFDEDARLASSILDITLTSRDAGPSGRIPMCGVPFHSADGYVARLLAAGYRVAICEQVQDPKEAKGLVKREIIRTVSPGTITDPSLLEDDRANYLVAISGDSKYWGLAAVDITTGHFTTTQMIDDGSDALLAELMRLKPAEVLIADGAAAAADVIARLRQFMSPPVTRFAPEAFSPAAARKALLEHFGVVSLSSFGCEELYMATSAAGAVIRYVRETQRGDSTPISTLRSYSTSNFMVIDASSRRNLELTQTIRDGSKRGSLIWVLDRACTAMGSRMLRYWLEQPLVDPTVINSRLDCVEELFADPLMREDLSNLLHPVCDMERLMGRVVFGSANARDLVALGVALEAFQTVKARIAGGSGRLSEMFGSADPLADIALSINNLLVDEPPFSIREGGMVRAGVNEELDDLRNIKNGGKAWVESYEQQERERTGIKSLKVSFNQVFGYYIEVTKANLGSVPDDYIRRQTLSNAERYITPVLKEYEEKIVGADDRICEIEYGMFQALRQQVADESARMQTAANTLAYLDVCLSLASVASKNGYVRPVVDEGDVIDIRDGRHPVVEALSGEPFVANSCHLDSDEPVSIITGPNMAGKSTYIRQVAVITLLAQMGSYVPASYAHIGVVDRIFTRVGASDDLATGRSTFMVELNEVANILNHATSKSLVILDEIGRGTSTFDGLSIAWAVTEYIHDPNRIGAKTLFATHYHELTELEKVLPGVRNFSVAIKQVGEDIVFLRKIIPGGAGRSFGIEVARLAGLPNEVVERAREILANLEQTDDLEKKHQKRGTQAAKKTIKNVVAEDGWQLGLFGMSGQSSNKEAEALTVEIANLDINSMTPVEALVKLSELNSKAKAATKITTSPSGGGLAVG